ncbi:MAG: hypothetical protein QM820_51935 [Minicystis sp.]
MKRACLVALLGVAACSGSLPDEELGSAADPQLAAYSIAGVRMSPLSVHFTGLPWLLNSVEATGPIVVTAHVGTFVLPTMTTTVSEVAPAAVSGAVGYSLSQRRDLYAVSSATIPAVQTSRLEAYASFEETFWDVVDATTGVPLGSGASFNPSGVFFQTVDAKHTALPDMGLFTFVQGCENLKCFPLPAFAGGAGEADAGAESREVPGFIPSPINPIINAGGGEGGVGEPRR